MVGLFTLECTCTVRKSKRNGSELRDIVKMASAKEERGQRRWQFALVNKLVRYRFF
jgi:hypothetical protein